MNGETKRHFFEPEEIFRYVVLYPNGDRPQFSNFVSIYLHNCLSESRNVQMIFTVKNSEDCYTLSTGNAFLSRGFLCVLDGFHKICGGSELGYHKFIHHDTLWLPGETYYENQNLNLFVQVQFQPVFDPFAKPSSSPLLTQSSFQVDLKDSMLCVVCMDRVKTSGFLHEGV